MIFADDRVQGFQNSNPIEADGRAVAMAPDRDRGRRDYRHPEYRACVAFFGGLKSVMSDSRRRSRIKYVLVIDLSA
jgi:hypothetical protein